MATTTGTEADYRRSVSASYYAVFHLLSAAVASQACPPTPVGLRSKCQRALDHRVMKNAMASFLTQESLKRFSAETGISCIYSGDIADIAKAFGEVQEARHLADYDVLDSDGTVGFSWALDCVVKAK